MVSNYMQRGRTLRIAFGITMLVLMMTGGANATKNITDNANGGDCNTFGIWDNAAKICTMTTDLNEGIQIGSDNVTLEGNGFTITGTEIDDGVTLFGRNGVTIRNLNVKGFMFGIRLGWSSNNIFTNNTANSNLYGFLIEASSNNNRLIKNTMSSNNNGIEMADSHNNIFTYNTFDSNPWGVWSESSNTDNVFYLNNFINFSNYDDGSNQWDDGSIGNHYSYFDEPIEGCYDNDTNGICDSNYIIQNQNVDRYPLVSWNAPESPRIIVVSPNGGEIWARGTVHKITWSSVGTTGPNVTIQLLKNGLVVRTVASSTPNDGSEAWTIPKTQTRGKDYKIRIKSTSNSAYKDTSDKNFRIS